MVKKPWKHDGEIMSIRYIHQMVSGGFMLGGRDYIKAKTTMS